MNRFGKWASLSVGLGLLSASNLAYAEDVLDTGDTAWVLISTALVLMMTLPGLALFYAGMVRKKNILSTMMHSYGATAVVSVLWVIIGYSLAFSEGSFNAFVGGFDHVMLANIGLDDVSGTIPVILFVVFQLTFAVITVAILAGSLAERIKFGAFMWFSAAWVVLAYAPVCHWVWGGGWLTGYALDFAGGTVVHINAGVAGLVLAALLGKRKDYGKGILAPANLSLTLIGAGLVWVGWFGFNGGSALGANGSAAMALVVSQVAAAIGAIAWMVCEYIVRKKASALGGASGAIAGLVGITPAAGFVDVFGALAIGAITAIACFVMIHYGKRRLGIDDSLDAFGLHGVGGIVGAVLTGVFVSSTIYPDAAEVSMATQLWLQIEGVLATIAYSAVMTAIIGLVIKYTIGLRVDAEDEYQGLDLAIHGEKIAD
ncbi:MULTISPECIES: ammonium transporter [Moraxella]|uniref:Ammonium transporter n=2 Tax=Moraxella catarrhalis TaxID=480 RepID=A0A7Z0V0A4_MORCA|nr:ammonium transporter [Moraxella catarrhalis]OAV02006.1 Ammonium transporter [Moraxella catarrhalis]STY82087.1 Ammonia transporter [Moraxella catarrhalis]